MLFSAGVMRNEMWIPVLCML